MKLASCLAVILVSLVSTEYLVTAAKSANITSLTSTGYQGVSCPVGVPKTTTATLTSPKVAIIGSGPAGMGAAIYLGRANCNQAEPQILVIEGDQAGGTPMKAGLIQNYPGHAELDGSDLMAQMRAQAQQNNVQFLAQKVTKVDFTQRPFKLTLGDGQTVTAPAVIIATGNKPISTNLASEQTYQGKGVAYCANCDGPFFKNKVVAVIGGGYGALRETGQLKQFAKQIYIINKNDQLKGPEMLLNHAKDPMVTVLNNCELADILGDGTKVTGVEYTNLKTKTRQKLAVDGVFVALGQLPNSMIFADQVKLNEKNEIIVDCNSLQTSVPGIWAVGDVTNVSMHQIPTAVGEGYKAGLQAEDYLKKLKAK